MHRPLNSCPRIAVAGILAAILLATCASPSSSAEQASPRMHQSQFRRPAAIAVVDEGRLLMVANRRSGSLSIVDLASGKVTTELGIGRALADMAVDRKQRSVFIVDQDADELIVLRREGRFLQVASRVGVRGAPVGVALSPDGKRCFVASLWSRRLTIVDVADQSKPQVLHTIDLPFAPRLLNVVPAKNRLVVADAFGGHLAVVDTQTGKRVALHALPSHNIRGMALSATGDKLLVANQILHAHTATTRDGVHWGGVLLNVLHEISIESLLRSDGQIDMAGSRRHLGYPDRAAGDPAGAVATTDGRRIVAFAGVNEVAVGDRAGSYFRRVAVGRRPTALALSDDQKTLYCANTNDDSISIIDIDKAVVVREILLGPQPKLTSADRGELLFYDASLARDGWFSCHSCHTDGHSNGRLNDNLGDESYGAPKRILSLLGTGDTGPWAWNGRARRLTDQIHKSVEVTMQGEPISDRQSADLAAYLRTLKAPPSLTRSRASIDEPAALRGGKIFERQGCADCHAPPEFTSPDVYDVSLADELGNRRFNPPSLRGVSQRSPLLHDGRAESLQDLFLRHKHGLEMKIPPDEMRDLLEFLRGL